MGQVNGIRCQPICGPSCFTVPGELVEKIDAKQVQVESDAERGEAARALMKPQAAASSRVSRVYVPDVDGTSTPSRYCCMLGSCGVLLTLGLLLMLFNVRRRALDSSFDCAAGLDVWELDWSTEKMHYCCTTTGMGCASFDCEGPESGWTELQTRWCCEVHGIGSDCKLALPYDCLNGLEESEGWEPLKGRWCCEHQGVGCPGDKPQEHVEEEEVTKEPGGGVPSWLSWLPFWQGEDNKVEEEHEAAACRIECTLDGVVSTCRDWVHDFSRIVFNAQPQSCDQAFSLMRTRCDQCSGCPLEAVGCAEETTTAPPTTMRPTTLPPTTLPPTTLPPTTLPPTTLPPTTLPPTTLPPTTLPASTRPPEPAVESKHKVTTSNDPTAEPPLHDCSADVDQWTEKWSDEKKVWCCRNEATMCPF